MLSNMMDSLLGIGKKKRKKIDCLQKAKVRLPLQVCKNTKMLLFSVIICMSPLACHTRITVNTHVSATRMHADTVPTKL